MAGLDSLPPYKSGQWHGFDAPQLIRPGHESRLVLLGSILALVGFCLPLVGVQYAGSSGTISFSGPQLLAFCPWLWAVPALAGLLCVIAIREPERKGRLLLGVIALAALSPIVLGLAGGYAQDTNSGISPVGFFGTLAHLKSARDADYTFTLEAWKAEREAAAKADTKGLEDDDEMGGLDDLEDEEEGKKKVSEAADRPPVRPAEPELQRSGFTIGFYLVLLGLMMAWTASWPWTETALAWVERVTLVLLLLAMLVLSGLPVLVRLDAQKQIFSWVQETVWMERIARMSVIWVGLIGACLATRERGHIAIEVLERFAPKAWCTWIKLFSAVFAVAVLLALCAAAGDYVQLKRSAMLSILLNESTPPAPFVEIHGLGIVLKEWMFTLVFPVGLFLLALRFSLLGGQDLLGVKFDHHFGDPR